MRTKFLVLLTREDGQQRYLNSATAKLERGYYKETGVAINRLLAFVKNRPTWKGCVYQVGPSYRLLASQIVFATLNLRSQTMKFNREDVQLRDTESGDVTTTTIYSAVYDKDLYEVTTFLGTLLYRKNGRDWMPYSESHAHAWIVDHFQLKNTVAREDLQ